MFLKVIADLRKKVELVFCSIFLRDLVQEIDVLKNFQKEIDPVRLAHIVKNLIDYESPESLKWGNLPSTDWDKIVQELKALGSILRDYMIDIEAYYRFIEEVQYPEDYIRYHEEELRKGVFYEKALEHYIGDDLLRFKEDDIYVDIAGYASPYFEYVAQKYDIKAYKLDLRYKKGIHGNLIGGDATATGLPDNFCSKITLHCSLEMFEGDSDIRLIPELYRILRPGGKAVILPLYMHDFAYIDSDPQLDIRDIQYDKDERRVWRYCGSGIKASRKYSPKTLKKRILDNLSGFDAIFYKVKNLKDINDVVYCHMVLELTKPMARG